VRLKKGGEKIMGSIAFDKWFQSSREGLTEQIGKIAIQVEEAAWRGWCARAKDIAAQNTTAREISLAETLELTRPALQILETMIRNAGLTLDADKVKEVLSWVEDALKGHT
jgi:hypothetical protein